MSYDREIHNIYKSSDYPLNTNGDGMKHNLTWVGKVSVTMLISLYGLREDRRLFYRSIYFESRHEVP